MFNCNGGLVKWICLNSLEMDTYFRTFFLNICNLQNPSFVCFSKKLTCNSIYLWKEHILFIQKYSMYLFKTTQRRIDIKVALIKPFSSKNVLIFSAKHSNSTSLPVMCYYWTFEKKIHWFHAWLTHTWSSKW